MKTQIAVPPSTGLSETRDKILRSAAEIFAENGFRNSSIRQIAIQAGVNDVTIFRYFPAKDQLCWRAVDWQLRELEISEDLMRLLDQPGTPQEVIGKLSRAVLRVVREHHTLVRLLNFTALELTNERKFLYELHLKPVLEKLVMRVQRWIEAGELRSVEPVSASIAILGVLFSHSELRRAFPKDMTPDNNLEVLAAECTQFCLNGLSSTQTSNS